MPPAWPRLLRRFLPRRGWVQVEVTTHCQAACVYCPHTVYRESWQQRHLPLATFHTLLPALARKSLAYLQGWGEPFLHPDFFTMVALAKKAGCRVGTTTNGMLLDDRKIGQIVESGLDVIAFSLAGIGARNDAARPGARFGKIVETIDALNHARAGRTRPQINLAYMLLRSGLADLERLPQDLQGLGLAQVVLSTLDFVPAPELAIEALAATDPEEYRDLCARLEEVTATGRRRGLEIHYQLRPPGPRRLLCPENVQQGLVVAADGGVSPCVFTNLPVSGAAYWTHGHTRPYHPLIFGNINDQSLAAIWRCPAYVNFRRSFYTGKLATPCQHCLKL